MTTRIPLYGRDGSLRAFALVDDADADWLNAVALSFRVKRPSHGAEVAPWRLASAGYAKCASGRRGHMIYMHRLVLGLEDGDERYGDHINGDRLDNRRSNLRVLTSRTNGQNRASHEGSSRFRGVTRLPDGRWRAGCNIDGRWVWCGAFETEQEAAEAARRARAVHQPFAVERNAVAA